MKKTTSQILRACSLSVTLLGSAAMVAAISVPDVVYADSGKGNGSGNGNGGSNGGNGNGGGGGNGNGGGGGNGNGGGSYNGGGGGTDKASASKKKSAKFAANEPTEVVEATAGKIKPKSKRKDGGSAGLAHPSELGALNAAHANPMALENASPNSRVGRIAAYRDAVLEGQQLEIELEEKSALLASLPMPRELSIIDDALDAANTDVTGKAGAVEQLQAQLDSETDEALRQEIQNQLDEAVDLLDQAEAAAEGLRQEREQAVLHETLTAEVEDLTQRIEDQPLVERAALEAAANKPVTDDVEAAVKALLGL